MVTSRRARITIIVLAVALVLSLSATTAIAIAWSRDRAANHQALADAQTRIHLLETHVSAAAPSASPTTLNATTTPAATPATATPTASSQVISYAQLTHMTDSQGHDWIFPYTPPLPPNAYIQARSGAAVTLTSFAKDAQSRQIEFEVWEGDSPNQVLLCGWGGSICTWTAQKTAADTCYATGCSAVNLWIAARHQGAGPARLTSCFKLEPCDDKWSVPFVLSLN